MLESLFLKMCKKGNIKFSETVIDWAHKTEIEWIDRAFQKSLQWDHCESNIVLFSVENVLEKTLLKLKKPRLALQKWNVVYCLQ